MEQDLEVQDRKGSCKFRAKHLLLNCEGIGTSMFHSTSGSCDTTHSLLRYLCCDMMEAEWAKICRKVGRWSKYIM